MKKMNTSYENLYNNLQSCSSGLNIYNRKEFIKIKSNLESPSMVTFDGILLCLPSPKWLQQRGSLYLDKLYKSLFSPSSDNIFDLYEKAKKQSEIACNYFGFVPQKYVYKDECGKIISSSIVPLKIKDINIVLDEKITEIIIKEIILEI